MKRVIARTDKSLLSRWWWSIDRTAVLALGVLIAVGFLLVSAASPAVAERLGLPPFYFVQHQLVFLAPSLALLFMMSTLSRKGIWRVSSVALVGSMFLALMAIFFGSEVKGATRWVSLFGFSIQPSEFIKPAFAVVSSWLIARHKTEKNFHGQQITLGLYLTIIAILMSQPDLGMSFVVSAIWGVQVFLSGLPMIVVAILLAAGAGALFGAYLFFPHVTSRIDRFLDPAAGDNYQVQKSLDAFAHGGWFGTGPGHGIVKLTLPDAHADFVFAVAGEEFGMLFDIGLIVLYGFIIVRCVMRVMNSDDLFTMLAVCGLALQFGLQSMIHMGSSLHLLPAKGMTLPFISYGGSSLLAMGFGMGILLALTRKGET